ncbi:MAG: GNAT family N-acetyltransferase [Oscillospiraceae bacterium]
MLFRLLSKDEILKILVTDMQYDFHPSEIKSPELIQRRIAEGRYFARGLFEDDKLLVYAFFVKTEKYLLLDYLAVDRSVRGKGFGSLVLRYIAQMPEAQERILILEVEDPDFSENERDRIRRIRRIGFYRHNGMCDLGIKTQVLTDNYLLLGASPASPDATSHAIDLLYRTVYLPEFVQKHIIIK